MADSTPLITNSFRTVLGSVGRQHEKPLKQAFYNTGALAFFLVSGAVAISAYYVLEAFLRPLIWAALCGTFLFPFKQASTKVVRGWLTDLEKNNKTLLIATALLPLETCRKCFQLLESVAKGNWKLLLTVFVCVPLFYALVIFHPFYQIYNCIEVAVVGLMNSIALFNYPLAVWSMFAVNLISLCVWDNDSEVACCIKKFFSIVVWFIMAFHLISLTGSWKVPIVLFLGFLIVLGYIEQKKAPVTKTDGTDTGPASRERSLSVKFVVDKTLTLVGIKKKFLKSVSSNDLESLENSLNTSSTSVETIDEDITTSAELFGSPTNSKGTIENTDSKEESMTPVAPTRSNSTVTPTPSINRSILKGWKTKKKKRSSRSDPYFIALFWLFALSFFWSHLWIFSILLFLLPLKYLLKFIVSNQMVESKLSAAMDMAKKQYVQKEDVISPWVVRKVLSLLYAGDQKLISYVNGTIDKLMSMMIILCLVVLAFLGTAFFAIQVQQESSYLVTVATNVVNQTIVSNKEYLKWLNLNDSDIRHTFDTTIHSGYIVARGKMAEYISSVVTSKESNTTYMEHQLTQLMDQLYETWYEKDNMKRSLPHVNNNNNNSNSTPLVQHNVLLASWNKMKMLASSSDFAKLFEIFKENLHTMYSVLDSIWLFLKGNMSLMISIITTTLSILVFSGAYILNVLISSIIFATTLFYLLSSSSNEYKLMELLSSLSMGTKFAESIAKAVQDVFGASLKMATFYFLFTWLTHDLFRANLVFIPAAIAATLGVIPFVGTYWAAVPAALEIWLIQKKGVLSLFLVALHFLPTYVVDPAIYSEIGEGGHPYLTGLAVAGGVYCFGLEGAFFGPFVLCCLIAAFDTYNAVMNSNERTASPTKSHMTRSVSVIQ